jgi:hypothetical protein
VVATIASSIIVISLPQATRAFDSTLPGIEDGGNYARGNKHPQEKVT